MPYKLLLSEQVTPAVRRMMVEQLSRAQRSLCASEDLHSGVHKARKHFKKARSLLRLSRPIIGEDVFAKENHRLRDLGRALAQPRDAGALLETLLRFEGKEDFTPFGPLLFQIKELILHDKSYHERELEVLALGPILEALEKTIETWKNRHLPEAGFEELAHGLAINYNRGRKSLKKAVVKDETFYLHEWRKDVQHYWRNLQVLTLLWPEDIMPRIKLAREISKLLGTEHDLDELALYIKKHKKILKAAPDIKPLRKPFLRTSKAIQRDLCLHAVERGRRLYALEPKALANAMSVYWQTGQALQPMPGVVQGLADLSDRPQIVQEN